MMLRTLFTFTLILILFATLSVGQETANAPQTLREPNDRFNGTTRIRLKDVTGQAKVADVKVVIQNWILDGGQKRATWPFKTKGLLIVQLRGGELTTIIDGKRQERKNDEFWTVLPDKQMGVETENDSAIIQTIMIEAP
jgi:hypothetical protein